MKQRDLRFCRKLSRSEWGSLALRAVIWAVTAFLFLLFYSSSTSPRTDYYGTDSAFFVLVGRGMTRGMLPYRDFFDMKGPYLFLIEHIGQVLNYGKSGIFLVQCGFLFISLCIMDAIYLDQFKNSKFTLPYELICVGISLVIASFTFDRGNLTEEYALPFLLLALFLALRYFKQSEETGDYRHPTGMGFYYGFAFGVLALIRITNAATIGAIILTISIGLLVKKEFKNLFANGLAFILGCIAAFLPMFIYYACNGLLGTMLSQVFGFGVQYSAEVSFSEKLSQFFSIYGECICWTLLPILVLAIFHVKNWRYWLLSVSAFFVFLLAVLLGNVYLHYFTLGIPNLVLGLALLLEQLTDADILHIHRWNLKKVAAIGLICLIIWAQKPHIDLYYKDSQNQQEWAGTSNGRWEQDAALDIKSYIPESDYDSVYAYGMDSCSRWYVHTDLFPPHRYCDWQEHYIELNPQIGNELEAWLRAQSPKWIVTPVDYSIAPVQIADAIENNYHVYAQNKYYTLYCANGNIE